MLDVICYMLHLCYMLYAICFMLYANAMCYMLYAICYMRYAICYMLYAICFMLGFQHHVKHEIKSVVLVTVFSEFIAGYSKVVRVESTFGFCWHFPSRLLG